MKVQEALPRREWIVQVLRGAAAASLIPVPGIAQPAPNSSWTPQFLSADQNATLIVLGERILPGSTAAHCNRVIDLMLAIDSDKNKNQLLQALEAFDAVAQRGHGQPFRSLSASSQDQVLTAASGPGAALLPHFTLIKEWVADTYWSSEQGLRNLGWNGQMAWTAFPGCEKMGPQPG